MSCLCQHVNPLSADFKMKGRTPCAELLVFFCLFSDNDVNQSVKYSCNVFSLLLTGFLSKAAKNQKNLY